jgi:hypothetical protein
MVMVELAEEAYDPGRTIVLQTRLSEPSEQDRELGMDSYCLSDELGRSVYDCVRSCEVADGMVHLELSEVAVRLGFDQELTVALELDGRMAGLLSSALTMVLSTFGPAGEPKLVFAPTA